VSFYRVRNWERYQNADVAKKSPNGVLPWVKLWTKEDYELDREPYHVRLLFVELLKLAGREMNAIPSDLNWISTRCGMAPEDVAEGVAVLLRKGWLSETKTNRRSRQHSRGRSRPEVEVEVEKNKRARERANLEAAERYVSEAAHYTPDDKLRAKLADAYGLTDEVTVRRLLGVAEEARAA